MKRKIEKVLTTLGRSLLPLLFFACTYHPEVAPKTGCWTGVLNGKRVLINGQCFTEAQVVKAEQSSSWALLLQQYTDLKYETAAGCQTCHQKYPL